MKKICYLFIGFTIPFLSIATVRTVSNQPSGGAQFNTIQLAVDASADGDTVYVHGSANIYDAFALTDKKLAIIGPGWAPDKDIALQANINGCNLRNSSNPGSPSGTELQGLIFLQGANLALNFGSDLAVASLRIIRCQFNSTVNFNLGTSNDLFEGCLFLTSINFTTNSTNGASNILFQNNQFYANQCCTSSGFTGLHTNISNVQFDHNVFYGDGSGAGVLAFSGCQFLTFSNNIFSRRNPSGISNSTFTNNITINCGSIGDSVWIRNGNVGTGNIAAQNPQTTTDITTAGFSGLNDFTITSGPANNAGSDGKDIGLLYEPTGSLNFTNSRNSRFPRMFSMNITTPTVAAGGNINVVVEARKSN
jgi:hypothetical protein